MNTSKYDSEPRQSIKRDQRALARLGAELASAGRPEGHRLRRLALRSIRRKRRAFWRFAVQERLELGYRDLGEAGA
jgi:hypothetical protein